MSLLSEFKGTRKIYKLLHTEKKLELLLLAAESCTAGNTDCFFLPSRMCDIVWDLNDKDIMQDETDKKDTKQGQRLRNTHCIPCLHNTSNTSRFSREKYSRAHTFKK